MLVILDKARFDQLLEFPGGMPLQNAEARVHHPMFCNLNTQKPGVEILTDFLAEHFFGVLNALIRYLLMHRKGFNFIRIGAVCNNRVGTG